MNNVDFSELDICYLTVLGSDSDKWTLGSPFLIEYYSLFDVEERRIGFTKAASL